VTAWVVHLAVGQPSAPYGAALGDVAGYATQATQHVHELADQLAAHHVELCGPAATRDAAARAIRAACDALRGDAPELFVLSFAGHGGKIEDKDGDEVIDHEDEAWALDDAPLIDDEIMALLREFTPNVHIAVLSNCCFAGGIDVVGTRGPRSLGADERARLLADRLAARRRAWYDAVARLAPGRLYAELARHGAAPGTRRQMRGAPLERPPRRWVLAAVCQTSQAFFATSGSAFSSTILDTVFPSSDGVRRRAADVTYRAVGEALERASDLPLFARPTVTGPEAVLRGPAFVAI
jgi:hypothetical protein